MGACWGCCCCARAGADFVRRFANKTLAITGYECDPVRVLPNGTEEHVPIYDQYNHHHAAWVVGGGAAMVDLGPAGRSTPHGQGRWAVRQQPKKTAARRADAAGPPRRPRLPQHL